MTFKREAWVTYACLVPVVGGVVIASGVLYKPPVSCRSKFRSEHCSFLQEVRYHSSKMVYVIVLPSGILMVAVNTQLHQCILFPINQIVWLSLTLNICCSVCTSESWRRGSCFCHN